MNMIDNKCSPQFIFVQVLESFFVVISKQVVIAIGNIDSFQIVPLNTLHSTIIRQCKYFNSNLIPK